jgi:hypothetical protein
MSSPERNRQHAPLRLRRAPAFACYGVYFESITSANVISTYRSPWCAPAVSAVRASSSLYRISIPGSPKRW